LAFVIPLLPALIAFVIGVLLIPRRHVAAGVSLIILSLVCAFGGLIVFQSVFVKSYRVPSESMEPTLSVGDHILVNRLASDFSVGDIVVFHPPAGAKQIIQCGDPNAGQGHAQPCGRPTPQAAGENFLKRIVAGPNDTVAIRDGHVIRNGTGVRESYVRACGGGADCNFPQPITVPPDHWFLLGDNRGSSDDSRFWGPVPTSWIVGKKFGPSY
jgi:signal peptidase I